MTRLPQAGRARAPRSWRELARLTHALGHPTRVRMVRLLANHDRSCGELVSRFPLAQSTVSQHLRMLARAGLVRARPAGRAVWYHLDTAALESLKTLVSTFDRPRSGAAGGSGLRRRRRRPR